ncbi:uncharacterized protein LOC128257325 [Drosophila gunungcola]|uniref:F-box domain-containing protein n=1 Tax=Drosophila gunungcola TaxID=103775 RepID=A0A9P9YR97_9MUSC|nr:uncharacterized protein LOC128257325 [Drosophila gunungcola]KAI8041607.1 hypothetical protein M5D96_005872 [Drosophila gunungcola]
MSNQRTITDLPLEVLDLIFMNLRNLRDKLRLAQVHKHLGKGFAYHSRNDYKRFCPKIYFPVRLYRVLLAECGSSIEEFICGSDTWSDLLAKSIAKHCPNLESVNISVSLRNSISVQTFLLNMANSLISVEIKLNDNCQSPRILNAVAELKNLRKLLYEGYMDRGVNQLHKLVALEELRLDYQGSGYRCRSVNLLQICGPMTNLRCLTVTNICISAGEGFHSMIWPNLKELKMQNCEISSVIPDCPKLKTVFLKFCKCRIRGYVCSFILKNGKNIEEIDESCEPAPFDGHTFLEVIRNCRKLQLFSTPMGGIKIYQALVSSLVDILKENETARREPFELILYCRDKLRWIRRFLQRTSNPQVIHTLYLYKF